MSYILDALRKSDHERRRGAAPSLLNAPFAAAVEEPRARWLYPGLALVLAAAGFALGWMRPWESGAPPVAPKSIAAAASAVPAVQAIPERESAVAPRLPAVKRAVAPAPVLKSAPPAVPAAPQVPVAAAPEKVVSLSELPAQLRQELPPMRISVHAYSRAPGERLVDINDRLLHEGDALAPGLVLESITPEGMIFNFRGTRFSRGVQ